MKVDEAVSLAYEAARLCRLNRTSGAQAFVKYRKRVYNRKIVKRVYYVRKEEENKIDYINMKILGLPKNTESENYNGLLSHYHLHFDSHLGIGRAAIQRIPCVCFSYREKILFHGKIILKQVINQGFREIKVLL